MMLDCELGYSSCSLSTLADNFHSPEDQLGTLNLLTPEVVANAAKEIKTGQRVSLDWKLNMPSVPMFGRQAFGHEIRNKAPRSVNDDVLTFNTQCSSQWDGLRHYG
jgi:hypothetical protein